MNKIRYSIFAAALLLGLGVLFFGNFEDKENSTDVVQNVEVRDGIQYITIYALGGYSPRVTNAEAGIPTKLIMKTNGTYDCSSSLVIRSIGYKKNLPQTGEEEIDLGVPQANTTIQGACSMGMYSFTLRFK